jgi:hypothetical protein
VPDGHEIVVDYVDGVFKITAGPIQFGASFFGTVQYVDPDHKDHQQPINPL